MTKRRVFLCQVNNLFGDQCFLPYSVGLLRAYAEQFDDIRANYRFEGYAFLREHIPTLVENLKSDPPDVVGASFYIWNAEWTLAFCKAVREAFPDCLIVAGGQHVPVKSEAWLREHPQIDVAVHYEGEATFTEVLRAKFRSPMLDNFAERVEGVSFLNEYGEYVKTSDRPRIKDMDEIPSPYTEGCFDELLTLPYKWHPLQETNRGCVYSCSFCQWGGNLLSKLYRYSDDRLKRDIDWFVDHRSNLSMLYNCDANWGILPRDLDLTKYMAQRKAETGYPDRFRAAYAKNTNERVYEIAKVLSDAGMNKGVTLSFQSLDQQVLTNVARKNIKMDNFRDLMARYRRDGITTYSELIIGLPGETYDTFADGIDLITKGGQHDSTSVYTCEILPNAEMGDPEYQKKHGIKVVKTPVLHFHATPQKDDPHTEFYELVVETATLPPADWLKCQMFAWAVQAFHNLGLTKAVAVYLHATDGISYRQFYEELLTFAFGQRNSTHTPWSRPLGNAWWQAVSNFTNLRHGKDWGNVDARFGGIVWPPEEYGFLTCAAQSTDFYMSLKDFLVKHFLMDEEEARELVTYQQCAAVIPTPFVQMRKFTFNIHEVVQAGLLGECVPKKHVTRLLKFTNPKQYESLEDWAKNVVWWGRKGGKFLRDVEVLS